MTEEVDLAGTILAGRYRVGERLGAGGMGTVYAGEHLEMGRRLAIKVLRADLAPHTALVERFKREARAAAAIEHENIIDCLDVGHTDSGVLYYVMELLRGEDLLHLLRRERTLTWPRARAIAAQMCRALAEAHARGIVHRDLKPSNVYLVRREGNPDFVKILDFGIAKITDLSSEDGQDGLDALTARGEVIGTTPYMAPEQAAGEAIDLRIDVYATGVILFQMLSGGLPFRGKTPRQILSAVLTSELPALTSRNPDAQVSPRLEALLRRCMHRDREQRFPDMTALYAALTELGDDVHQTSRAPSTLDETPSSPTQGIGSVDLLFSAGGQATRGHAGERAATAEADPEQPTAAHFSGLAGSQQRPGGFAGSELLPPGLVLVVLPFRGDELGQAIADELVDVLARTRGLRVLGTGAAARFREDRDPRAIGRALGASAVVDGTIQRQGERLRLSVRLLDASTGLQLWSDRQEGLLNNLFAFQESTAQRVAEELRVEMTTLENQLQLSSDVTDTYLKARRSLRHLDLTAQQSAIAAFHRCLAAAPEFRPARALLAMASTRASFLGSAISDAELDGTVERALADAPAVAESHVAAGMLALHKGELGAAVRHLFKALEFAPTCADAHECLGMLQCEAGRSEEGVRRLKLAVVLEPALPHALAFLARDRALAGDHDGASALLDELDRRHSGVARQHQAMRVRLATWRRDLPLAAKLAEKWPPGSAIRSVVEAIVTPDAAARTRVLDGFAARARNLRYRSLMHQLGTEAHASNGERADAERHLAGAAAAYLVDLTWLDGCPLLAPLRDGQAFAAARQIVVERTSALWNAQE